MSFVPGGIEEAGEGHSMSPEESSMNIEDFELDDADPVHTTQRQRLLHRFVPSGRNSCRSAGTRRHRLRSEVGVRSKTAKAFVADLEKGACLERGRRDTQLVGSPQIIHQLIVQSAVGRQAHQLDDPAADPALR